MAIGRIAAELGLESAKLSDPAHSQDSLSYEGLINHRYKLHRQLKNRHVSMIRLVALRLVYHNLLTLDP